MPSTCPNCGTELIDGAGHCTRCGSASPLVESAPAQAAVLPAEPMYLVRTSQTGRTHGPVNEITLREWIRQRQVSGKDAVCDQGGAAWIPILQSTFRDEVVAVASVCPRCGGQTVIVLQPSHLPTILIISGALLTPVFCLGTPMWVIGLIMRINDKGKTRRRCVNCSHQYSA